jgi:hypothetical protein
MTNKPRGNTPLDVPYSFGPAVITEPIEDRGKLPVQDAIVEMDGQIHRVVALVGDRFMFVHVATKGVYVAHDAEGGIALPDADHWRMMVNLGRARRVLGTTPGEIVQQECDEECLPPEKVTVACSMLDAAGVPMGHKAMSIWLAAHWSPALRARYGEHTNVHTLRYWRRMRKRAAQLPQDAS